MVPTGNFTTESTDLTSSTMKFKIFKDGRLLNKYVPPYFDDNGYMKLMIHFNRYKTTNNWVFDRSMWKLINKDDFIKMFKHYAEEINNFIY